jgi:hypothetical protein
MNHKRSASVEYFELKTRLATHDLGDELIGDALLMGLAAAIIGWFFNLNSTELLILYLGLEASLLLLIVVEHYYTLNKLARLKREADAEDSVLFSRT